MFKLLGAVQSDKILFEIFSKGLPLDEQRTAIEAMPSQTWMQTPQEA